MDGFDVAIVVKDDDHSDHTAWPTRLEPLDPGDITSWAMFISTARLGGALPVTFRADGDHVVVEVIVPYVTPAPRLDPLTNKIPLGIAEGFPVPVSARFKLPAYSPTDAAHFLRHVVREIYHHEIDEQFRVDGRRPFAPEHLPDRGES